MAARPRRLERVLHEVGLNVNPCPSVSLWPDINATAQQFSDGVADYVAAPYNNGAITYVEYGYAKQRGFPVASVLNKAGYYTQPTPENVAIALKGATLNADLTQNLGGVYNNTDPRAYPVSSYSYLIVPTTTAKPFSAPRATTLSKYILYMVCAGQQKAAQLGYSPLPGNLVQAAFNVGAQDPGPRRAAADQPVRQPDDHRRFTPTRRRLRRRATSRETRYRHRPVPSRRGPPRARPRLSTVRNRRGRRP